MQATFYAGQTSQSMPEGMAATVQSQPKNEEVAGLSELQRRNNEVMGQMGNSLTDMKVKPAARLR